MTESFVSKFNIDNMMFKYPWHSNKFPKADDLVIGYIKSIEDGGIKIRILDYMSIEGYMPFQELSKRRVYSIRSLFKEGQIKPLLVLAVDESKGFVDLSNKYVSMAKDDIVRLEKYGHLIRIMTKWIIKTFPTEDYTISQDNWNSVMEKTLWKLGTMNEAYDTFLDIKMENTKIEDVFDLDNLESLNDLIEESISYEVSLKIKLKLFTWGINPVSSIKSILNTVIEELDCKLEQVSPPEYDFVIKSSRKGEIFEINDNLDDTVSEIIQKYDDVEYELFKKVEEKVV